jgi:hypothetical protein
MSWINILIISNPEVQLYNMIAIQICSLHINVQESNISSWILSGKVLLLTSYYKIASDYKYS